MRARSTLSVLALSVIAGFSPAPLLGRWMVRRGAELGAATAALSTRIGATSAPAMDPPLLSSDSPVPAGEVPAAGPANRAAPKGRSRAVKSERRVFVSARTILRIAFSGAVPDGRSVPRGSGRPAGIALVGVSGLGVGLEDGDVISSVEGRAVRVKSDVVALVLAARANHATRLFARFWRGRAPGTLVVELPYLSDDGGVRAPSK